MSVEQAQKNLEKIDLDIEWSESEKEAIDRLTAKESNEITPLHLQEALQSSEIVVWWKKMQFSTMIDTFDTYVQTSDGRMLSLKGGVDDVPERVQNMIDSPKDNDLAYFVQKVSQFISYNVARWYGEQSDVVDVVTADAMLGKQTKRALSGLKHRVEATDDKDTFLSVQDLNKLKEADTLPEWIVYDEESGDYIAAEGYRRIDTYGTNYAVEKVEVEETKEEEPNEEPNEEESHEEINEEVDTIPIEVDKIWDKVMALHLDHIKSYYTYKKLSQLTKDNDFASYMIEYRGRTISFVDKNPNVEIHYISSYWKGSETTTLGSINIGYYDKSNMTHFDQKFIDLLAESWREGFYNQQLADSTIRWAKYSITELFPDKVNDVSYQAFFALFRKNTLLVDAWWYHTRVLQDGQDLKLMFRLDNKRKDKEYNKNLQIDLQKVLDEDWNISKDMFDEELKRQVSLIIEQNPQEFSV